MGREARLEAVAVRPRVRPDPGSNRFGLPAFYSLHAWIWKHNPAGTYAMWNPDVRCR